MIAGATAFVALPVIGLLVHGALQKRGILIVPTAAPWAVFSLHRYSVVHGGKHPMDELNSEIGNLETERE